MRRARVALNRKALRGANGRPGRDRKLFPPASQWSCVAVPSRIFVGLTVFGLICTLLIVPISLVVLLDVHPAPDLFDYARVGAFTVSQKIFLAIASLFSLAFTWLSWRSLLAGARRNRALREALAARKSEDDAGPPPGYM